MGILNVTPDSFSDGGHFFEAVKAIEHGVEMAQEGADIVDVGGESTRPYAQKITQREEITRVIPVIEALASRVDIPISIDTYKAPVAREALRAGASIINDISALRFDVEMAPLAADAGVPVVLMHMKGTPETMQDKPVYDNVVDDVLAFLEDACNRAVSAGIKEEFIIVDPGIGFGKSFDHNLQIIRDLPRLRTLGKPILLGSSSKAFIGHILKKPPHERDIGSMATIAWGISAGANMVRVHNVAMAVDTVKVADAIKRAEV
jgi:dihydropteroate synthase